jgi:hypothetical protein
MDKYLFNIEFIIFNQNEIITKTDKKIKDKLINNDLSQILSLAIKDLQNYKILDRMEPSISSIDENIQLRLRYLSKEYDMNKNSLFFYQNNKEGHYFEIDELIKISKRIRKELEWYLHYTIEVNIQLDISSD